MSQIQYYTNVYDTRTASAEETRNIVKWFDSVQNIQENSELEGTTDTSSIEIILKPNKK